MICVFWAYSAHGALLVPTSISGSISYGYGYSKTVGGSESEAQNIIASIAANGFIWQPWFIQTGGGLSFGFTRSNSSTQRASSTSQEIGGSLYLNVFPVSRFPFSLSMSHSNSRFDSGRSFGGLAAYETKSTQIFARQGYYPRSGYNNNFTWAHSRVETFSSTSVSDSLTAETRKSYRKSSWTTTANYSIVDISSSNTTPENWGLRFLHNYTPGNQTSISSNLSGWGNRSKGDGFSSEGQSLQASSAFSWRPEYRPFSFSGGARVTSGESTQSGNVDSKSESNSASLSLGVNYRLTRKMSLVFTGQGTGSFEETGGIETTSTAANAGASTAYNSDMYNLGAFQYFWNAAGGLSSSYVSTKQSGGATSADRTESTATAGMSLGHRASRGFSVGRATSLSVSLSQSVSGSGSDNGSRGWGTGIGGDISGSSRGIGGTTFAGINGSYSYSESEFEEENIELESQYVRANLSRNQTISRLSALTANATSQWRRQISSESDVTTRSADASLNYRHQRFLGIYALNFDSIASYIVTFNPGEDKLDTIDWRNTWRYTIGLLDLSLYFSLTRQGVAPTRGSVRFRATRSF
ncbi:MAG: hypothetical protein AMJ53_09790 [Gammaproteobacteria bacterium SG8_11]|nr:MAG: hypothetical protein AMJ53_09790 [Gammaproteobacteria bacterium SG8_11]